MKIAICDDERKDLDLMGQYCKRLDPGIEVCRFMSGNQLLQAFESEFYDLILLDIEMAEPNGYEVGQMLASREKKPLIIFTTKTVNYAVRGYGLAFRYLLKPVSYEQFAGVIRLALEKILPEKVAILVGNAKQILNASDIIYIEVLIHKVSFHLHSEKTITVRGALSEFMNQVSRSWFLQVHKSYCVNMDYIDRIYRNTLQLTDGTELPIGSKRQKEVHVRLQEYLRSRTKL